MVDKKILFLCPKLYDYEKKIIESLEKKGKEVVYFREDFKLNSENKLINYILKKQKKFFPKIYNKKYDEKLEEYFSDILLTIEKKKIKTCFIINGSTTPITFLKKLKQNKIKVLLHIWDDLYENDPLLEKFKYCNTVTTYSKYDANKYSIEYKGMFTSKIGNKNSRKYKILILGNSNSSESYSLRNKVFPKFINMFPDNFVHILSKRYSKQGIQGYKKNSLSYYEYMNALEESQAVLDIPKIEQKGNTTRVIEGLSLGVKIITTNKEIKNYEFYNENNIFLIKDENSIKKEEIESFLLKELVYDHEYWKKYYIDNWLDNLLEEK